LLSFLLRSRAAAGIAFKRAGPGETRVSTGHPAWSGLSINEANALNGGPNTVVRGIRSRGPQTAQRGRANDPLPRYMARGCVQFKADFAALQQMDDLDYLERMKRFE
jgi:hypothetical protein